MDSTRKLDKGLYRKSCLSKFLASLTLIISLMVTLAEAKVQIVPGERNFCSVAWIENNQINVAVANNADKIESLTIGVGEYFLGPRILDSKDVSIERGEVVICRFEKREEIFNGSKVRNNTVFLYRDKEMKELLDFIYVQGYHPAQDHYQLGKYVAKGGDTIPFTLFGPNNNISDFQRVIWMIKKFCLSVGGKTKRRAKIVYNTPKSKEVKYLNTSQVSKNYLPGRYGPRLLKDMENSHVIEFIQPRKIDFELSVPKEMTFTTLSVEVKCYKEMKEGGIIYGGIGGPQVLVCPQNATMKYVH